MWILSTEGRVVRLCWAHSKREGPNGWDIFFKGMEEEKHVGCKKERSHRTVGLGLGLLDSLREVGPLGPLGFDFAQHRHTLRPSSSRDPR